MKIRQGFVSNSSSSSFVIGCKELSEENFNAMFKTEHPLLKGLVKHIARVIYNNSEEKSLEDIMKDQYVDSYEELDEEYKGYFDKAKKKGFKIYMGYFSDAGEGGEGIEACLCETPISYEDDDLFFYSEGSY